MNLQDRNHHKRGEATTSLLLLDSPIISIAGPSNNTTRLLTAAFEAIDTIGIAIDTIRIETIRIETIRIDTNTRKEQG
jgi:hypothetical protein